MIIPSTNPARIHRATTHHLAPSLVTAGALVEGVLQSTTGDRAQVRTLYLLSIALPSFRVSINSYPLGTWMCSAVIKFYNNGTHPLLSHYSSNKVRFIDWDFGIFLGEFHDSHPGYHAKNIYSAVAGTSL